MNTAELCPIQTLKSHDKHHSRVVVPVAGEVAVREAVTEGEVVVAHGPEAEAEIPRPAPTVDALGLALGRFKEES
jgi:hypothetical protein